MIIPHIPKKSVKSFKFPKWIVTSFIVVNIAIFTAACMFIISYHSLNQNLESKKAEYQALQSIKDDEEEQLNEYKSNEEEIKSRIQDLKDLEGKLKGIIESKGVQPQSSRSIIPKLASRGGRDLSLSRDAVGSADVDFESLEDMYTTIDQLSQDIGSDIQKLDEATAQEESRIKALRAVPSVFPVSGKITSTYGYRKNPFGRGYEFHDAVDIAGSKGTPIRAAGDGVVVEAGWNSGGYGILVEIDHGNGYVSLYGHNSKVAVTPGDYVQRGQVIAYMGRTGRATGNHCHFEVRYNGSAINPYNIKQ